MTLELIAHATSPTTKKIASRVLSGMYFHPIPLNVPVVAVAMRLTVKIALDMTEDEAIIEEAIRVVGYAVGKVGDHNQTVHDLAVYGDQVTLLVNDRGYVVLPRHRRS